MVSLSETQWSGCASNATLGKDNKYTLRIHTVKVDKGKGR
jgi:hypothetical protein